MTKSDVIRVLIVDDEPLARKRIRALLRRHMDFEIIGESSNGREAADAIQREAPDLVFLDVQMPEMDGLTLIKTFPPDKMPLMIFVTAFDNHGMAAFDADAVDYLLKPYNEERFDKSIQQARARMLGEQKKDVQTALSDLVSRLAQEPKYLRQIAIRSEGRIFLVKVEDIDWIEAERNYVRLHVGAEVYPRRESIGGFEMQLDPSKFRRINRSAIVNLNSIKELRSSPQSDYHVFLSDGTSLVLSRSYYHNLKEFLG